MPVRKIALIAGQYYHIFNRGINHQPIFLSPSDYSRAIFSLNYYQHSSLPVKLSYLLHQPKPKQMDALSLIDNQPKLASIIAYCFMPNHFHFLLRQIQENGISQFLHKFQDSYAKYFNAKSKRTGSLLDRQFKSVLIETEDQLLHTSRYIHLNPYTGYIVKTHDQIFNYPWSSVKEYLKAQPVISDPTPVLSHFSLSNTYISFLQNQADYQRSLEKIKHLTFD